jgi:hypothetical protein
MNIEQLVTKYLLWMRVRLASRRFRTGLYLDSDNTVEPDYRVQLVGHPAKLDVQGLVF